MNRFIGINTPIAPKAKGKPETKPAYESGPNFDKSNISIFNITLVNH
jgi:hypothetical protein